MNNLSDFILTHTNNILPATVDNDTLYLPELKRVLNTYKKAVDNENKFSKIIKSKISIICDEIIKIINLYYEGSPAGAYKLLSELFSVKNLDTKLMIKNISEFENGCEYKTLYRGRTGENIDTVENMFHVPFAKRQFITTKRFSIAGCPSLYLSGSIYVCWLELNKPNFQNYYVSRVETQPDLQILDLAMDPYYCYTGSFDHLSYCVLWPFLCATSFIVKEQNRTFKSEYIISQLLLQVVKDRADINGIRYLSVKKPTKQVGHSIPLYVNYVFPAKQIKEEVYSSYLSNLFQLTPPFCVGEYDIYSPSNIWTIEHFGNENNCSGGINDQFVNSNRRLCTIRVIDGRISEYEHTKFYEIENLLHKLNTKQIKVNI